LTTTARQVFQRWIFVLAFLFGVPALLIWLSMPFLDMSHATYLTAAKDYKGAIRSLDRAIAFNGLLSVAYVKRGYDYELLNQPDKALADYNKAISMNPNDWAAYNNRAWLTANTGSLDASTLEKAVQDATRAIDICPTCAPPYHTRGVVLMKLKKADLALADFSRAVELDPKYAIAYYNRSESHKALGNTADADKDAYQAKELGFNAPAAPSGTE
jgi:tetratricopeptide (TPR) repeat protein